VWILSAALALVMSVSAFFLVRFADEVKSNGESIQALNVKVATLETKNDALVSDLNSLKAQMQNKDAQYNELDKKLAILESK
jgi:peptidoglycan hydrolase CwlO-like protein